MPEADSLEIGRLVDAAHAGDRAALERLLPIVYDELRRLARRYIRRERPGQTLEPTGLVHEAYMRLLADSGLAWQNRAHFMGIAARAMRQILIEHARARAASKRGGGRVQVTLDESLLAAGERPIDLLALDAALLRLAGVDREQAHIVELRFFGGLTVEEIAEAVGLSPATVKRRLEFAKAWLLRDLTRA
jgi:RNA polymerase sigma factor (TIGR02999 family)